MIASNDLHAVEFNAQMSLSDKLYTCKCAKMACVY